MYWNCQCPHALQRSPCAFLIAKSLNIDTCFRRFSLMKSYDQSTTMHPRFQTNPKDCRYTRIAFVCRLMTSWYDEHLRVYDLCHSHLPTFSVTQLSEMNFLCHFTEFMANSLLHSNGIYYAEWIKHQNVACLR